MKISSTRFLTAFLASVIITGPSLAAEPSAETEAPGQSFVHPSGDVSYSSDMRDDEMLAKGKPTDNGKVQYISGGIAASGMRAIDAEENAYNLKMLFVAKQNGEYLANVGVTITDSKGDSILDATAKGPVLLVRLPSGHYTVKTKTEGGSMLTQNVEVGDEHLASYVLRYPETKSN